jgi:hypothetical protein
MVDLPVMPIEQYCEPCKKLLCGEIEPSYEDRGCIDFPHHPDAESFKNALELPCSICSFAWNANRSSSSWLESVSTGTTVQMYETSLDEDIREILFTYNSGKWDEAYFIAFVPLASMILKEL